VVDEGAVDEGAVDEGATWPAGDPAASGEADEASMSSRDLTSDRTAVAEVERFFDEVEGALERLEGGTYGLCEACGEAIDDQRLAAAPTSRTCARHPQLTDPAPAG
jgi:RNA polymerase-binding transcription factor DksA